MFMLLLQCVHAAVAGVFFTLLLLLLLVCRSWSAFTASGPEIPLSNVYLNYMPYDNVSSSGLSSITNGTIHIDFILPDLTNHTTGNSSEVRYVYKPHQREQL